MATYKLTDWIPGKTPPLRDRPGVYECEWAGDREVAGIWFNFWDGAGFILGGHSIEAAAKCRLDYASSAYNLRLVRWRGVLQ